MGLFLSKAIVEKMGGEIWVESELDKGSKFMFTFKVHLKDPMSALIETESSTSLNGKTALLVDDVDINREIVMALLEKTRMQFICAKNGREAVKFFSSNPEKFDLILMDINMPEMDGVEATRRIRTLGVAEGTRVPIIAITANTSPDDVANYLMAGMNDHLGKPVSLKEILKKIKRYLK